jgi:hypothetical protein
MFHLLKLFCFVFFLIFETYSLFLFRFFFDQRLLHNCKFVVALKVVIENENENKNKKVR